MAKEVTVGIDLGTTFSCCFYHDEADRNGGVKIVRFVSGETTIPSSADFNHHPVVVGVPSEHAITEVKRLIGLEFDDEKVQTEIANGYFQYTIVKTEDGYCKIEFQPKNSEKEFQLAPEEVSAIILKQIRNEILKALGLPNTTRVNAVITVPAYFTDEQKRRTHKAAKICGMNLISMLQEPSAAAYAYKDKNLGNGYYLAFDLGGGTFDLTIMNVQENGKKIQYVKTSGDTHLGGLDFDKNFTKKIFEVWKEFDPDHNRVSLFEIKGKDAKARRDQKLKKLFKLRKLAEKAKIELSEDDETEIDLSEYYDGEDYMLPVTREQFEECNQHLFDRCIDITLKTLKSKKITKNMIKQVLLIGGSSQIPRIQEMLREEFPKAEFNNSINCNYVVAMGAALYARDKKDGMPNPVSETTAHTITILGVNGQEPLVVEGTEIPHTHEFWVEVRGRDAYTELYEERVDVHTGQKTTKKLGRYQVDGLPSGTNYCHFYASIQSDGILKVEGTFSNGKRMVCEPKIEKRKTSEEEIKESLEIVERFFGK